MNFLAHYELADGRSNYFRFGSMLPDFAKMGGGRVVRIKNTKERGELPAELAEVQSGIDFHFACDEAYDELDEYRRLKADFRAEIFDRHFSGDRLFRLLLPGLGADLLLDGWYQDRNLELNRDVQDCVRRVGCLGLEHFSSNPAGLEAVFSRFVPNMPDYGRPHRVADVVGGVLIRQFGRRLDESEHRATVSVMTDYQPLVLECAGAIEQEMRAFRSMYMP